MPDWGRKSDTKALNLVFNKLFDVRVARGLEKLNLFYLDQLMDSNREKTRRRKPKWFSLIEEKMIENAKKRIAKSEWTSETFKIREKKDKTIQIEHWRTVSEIAKIETRIEKCLGCKYNKSIVKKNCITCIKFDEGWKVIPKSVISKTELSMQMQSNFNLASLAEEIYHKDPMENKHKLKERNVSNSNKNSNCQQKKFCYYTNGSLQKEDKEKDDIAVMRAAVVQVNEKEEVSLEE
ncbi:38672_t:CDS:2, partial [Gigaspora margarita]